MATLLPLLLLLLLHNRHHVDAREHLSQHVYSSTRFGAGHARSVDHLLLQACAGDVYGAYDGAVKFNRAAPHASAGGLHIESGLTYILHADLDRAAVLHRQAKEVNATLTPPLAALYLAQHACPGLGDIFYVSAVTIKQYIDGGGNVTVLVGAKTMIQMLAGTLMITCPHQLFSRLHARSI